MRLDDASISRLKGHLANELSPLCDADPGVFADYILALMKHDQSLEELRAMFLDQLEAFLHADTADFVDRFIAHLSVQDYVASGPGAEPASDTVYTGTGTEAESEAPLTETQQPNADPRELRNKEQPREEEDYSDEDDHDRNFKHIRRGTQEQPVKSGLYDPEVESNGRSDHTNRPTDFSRSNMRSEDAAQSRGGETAAGGWERAPQRDRENGEGERQRGWTRERSERGREQSGSISDHKRRRSEDFKGDEVDGYRPGKRPTGWGPGPTFDRRNEFDREQRMTAQRFPAAGWGEQPEWGSPPVNGSGMAGMPDRGGRGGSSRWSRGGDRQRGGMGARGGYMGERRDGRCRDYDEKGVCYRGNTCPYDHGADRIVIDGDAALMGGARLPFDGLPNAPAPMGVRSQFAHPFGGSRATGFEKGFDSNVQAPVGAPEMFDAQHSLKSERSSGPPSESAAVDTSTLTVASASEEKSHHVMRGNFRGRGAARGGMRGGRAAPYQPTRNDTIVVENIPVESCSFAEVSNYFARFGTIKNINLDPARRRAVIQFDTYKEAHAAKVDPNPIFGNRFVKVYFKSSAEGVPSGVGDSSHPVSTGSRRIVNTAPSAPFLATKPELNSSSTAAPGGPNVAAMTQQRKKIQDAKKEVFDRQHALLKRQMDTAKTIQEKLKNPTLTEDQKAVLKQTLDQAKLSMEQTMEIMRKAQIEPASKEKAVPMSRTAIAEEKEKERLDRELDLISQKNTGLASGVVPTVDPTLRATLENLKAQASERGIDSSQVVGSERGGFFRGRGSRGGFAGRGGRGAGRMSYNLDNRSTKVQIKNIPVPAQELLKAHFTRFGETETIVFDDAKETGVINFKTRRGAERAIAKVPKIDGAPDLQLTWFQESPVDSPQPGANNGSGHEHVLNGESGGSNAINTAEEELDEEDDEDEDGKERNWKR
ncbi:RNA-binding protein 27 [Borealophlyctis nickersoniae]|nr:RNA-binding protein 27 [Borealophlyctis nickersoniae]